MNCVDGIVYTTADLDDAREAELLDLDALRDEVPIFGEAYAQVHATHPTAREKLKFNEALKRVLEVLATDLLETTQRCAEYFHVAISLDIRRAPNRLPAFTDQPAAFTPHP